MKVVTVREFEANFESIIDDCGDNNVHYRIQLEDGNALMLIPANEYGLFQDVYEDWIAQPENDAIEGFDHKPLPVQYVGEAEPEPLNSEPLL